MGHEIVLLFGGASSEHRVSVASAQNVAERLPSAALWFVSRGGAVHDCPLAELAAHDRPFERDFAPRSPPRFASLGPALGAAPRGAVFVLALHGGDGENGALQAELERRGLPFTGSGSAASALAYDKALAKARVASRGVRVARASVLAGGEAEIALSLGRLLRERGPLVVKPVADGSSVGLHILRAASQAGEVASAVARSGGAYLVEDFIAGTELTVGVIEAPAAGALALPPSEVRVARGAAFDFAGKYLGRGTVELTPAEVPAEVAAEAQRVALAAHEALGCEGYSRTDLIAGEGGVTFLETNTLPGLTRASFLPQQLAAAGLDLDGFLDAQIRLAAARRAREDR